MSLLKASTRNNFLTAAQQMFTLSQIPLPTGPASLLHISKMLSAALCKQMQLSALGLSVCLILLSYSCSTFIRYSSTQSLQAGTPLSMLYCQHCQISYCVCKWRP